MTSAKDDEAFWNSSEKLCFRFDNNEVKLTAMILMIIFCLSYILAM